jgi:hypothetical protein
MALYKEEVVETEVVVSGVYIFGPAPVELDIPDVIPPEVYPITITQQVPATLESLKDLPVSLTVIGTANPLGGPLFYQWQQRPYGTRTFIDIPNEIMSTYNFTSSLDKRDTQFRCKLNTNAQLLYSDFVSLTILGGISYIKFATYIKI